MSATQHPRFFLCLALVGLSAIALFLGYDLIKSGVGLSEDQASIEVAGFKVAVGTIGSLFVAGSLGFGWLAYMSRPLTSRSERQTSGGEGSSESETSDSYVTEDYEE